MSKPIFQWSDATISYHQKYNWTYPLSVTSVYYIQHMSTKFGSNIENSNNYLWNVTNTSCYATVNDVYDSAYCHLYVVCV